MIPCERRPIARPIALHRVSTATMQQLVVLCGLVGSGKSTFARAVEQHDPNWTRCNQDELGRRQVVEKAALAALDEGRNVLIDRTNIDRRQRADWLLLADEFRRRHKAAAKHAEHAACECERTHRVPTEAPAAAS